VTKAALHVAAPHRPAGAAAAGRRRDLASRRHRREQPSTRDEGFATAEAAVVLPALVLVLVLAIGVVVSVGAQLRCVDAARVGARAAARGDSDAAIRSATAAVAPRGAVVTVRRAGTTVQVVVRARVLGTGVLPAVPVDASATAEREPSG
jgi:Flp pilus assembly protein TadG